MVVAGLRRRRRRRLQEELLILIGVLWMLFFTSIVMRTAHQETTSSTTANNRRRPFTRFQNQQNTTTHMSTPTFTSSLVKTTTQQKSILEPPLQRILPSSQTATKTTKVAASSSAVVTSANAATSLIQVKSQSPPPPPMPLACQTPPGQSQAEGGAKRNPMGYQVLRRLQYFLQNDPYASSSSSSSSPFSKNTTTLAANNNQYSKTTILCILPFFFISEQRIALETYGQDCDKVLLINNLDDASTIAADLPETSSILYRLQVPRHSTTTIESSHAIMTGLLEKLHSIEYDWIHWASPDRYLVVLSLRSFLDTPPISSTSSSLFEVIPSSKSDQNNSNNNDNNNDTYIQQHQNGEAQPRLLESWEMINPSHSKYESLFGGMNNNNKKKAKNQNRQRCLIPKTWSRAATTQWLGKCLENDIDNIVEAKNKKNLTEWIATCFHDVMNATCSEVVIQPQAMKFSRYGPSNNAGTEVASQPQQPEQTQQQPQQPWLHLKRYFEIHASSSKGVNGDGDSDHHRLHAILHGLCDPYWDGLWTTKTTEKVESPDYYVHDPRYVRNHSLPFTYHPTYDKLGVCDYKIGQGDEGPNGIRGLEKIRLMETPPSQQQPKRILCMVYTHSGRHDQIQSIAETWGPRCDGFLAASNQTNVTIGAIHIPHEGPEQYSNMWLKVRAMWQYAYDHYLNDFDFFHIGGDDHYVIAENLRFVVSTGNWKGPWNQSSPLYLGGSLPLLNKRRYCNGGSGYTLNRAALQLLVEELLHTPRCWPHWQGSDEDRLIASCFRQVDGLECMDTNDEKNETRYHTWNVDQHVSWKDGVPGQDWESLVNEHGIAWKEGIGQISESSVSFHLKQPRTTSKASDSGMRRYHAILYGLCRNHSH